MAEAATVEPIVVSGRTFYPATDTTFEQDFFILDRIGETGMERMELTKDSDLAEVSMDIILSAYRSGKLFELLAGMVKEEGVPWTPEGAIENARFFATLTDQKDKDAIRNSLVGALLGFFVNAVNFSAISLKSLPETESTAPAPAPPPKVGEGLSISVSGTQS